MSEGRGHVEVEESPSAIVKQGSHGGWGPPAMFGRVWESGAHKPDLGRGWVYRVVVGGSGRIPVWRGSYCLGPSWMGMVD